VSDQDAGPKTGTIVDAIEILLRRIREDAEPGLTMEQREDNFWKLQKEIRENVDINGPDMIAKLIHFMASLCSEAFNEWARCLDVEFDSLLYATMSAQCINLESADEPT
jgi:hypothetical protein